MLAGCGNRTLILQKQTHLLFKTKSNAKGKTTEIRTQPFQQLNNNKNHNDEESPMVCGNCQNEFSAEISSVATNQKKQFKNILKFQVQDYRDSLNGINKNV